jgi:uncharacterized membrane protein
MRKAELRELFFSLLSLIVFLLSIQLISKLTTERAYNYTTGWGNMGWALALVIFVSIPTIVISIVLIIAAAINEIKIYNENRTNKIKRF